MMEIRTAPPVSFRAVFDRFGKAFANAFLHQQPVDDDLDRVVLSFIERDLFVKLPYLAVNAGPDKSVAVQFFEFFFEFALTSANDRGEDHHPLALRQIRRRPQRSDRPTAA